MDTFIVHPAGEGPYPAVIIYMDVWGIRAELLDIARRTAAAGYCCILPDLYYRQGTVRNEFRDADGRMLSLESLDDQQKEAVRAPLRRLTDAMVMEDTAILLRLASTLDVVSDAKIAAVGYCMGGRHALLAAGTFPDQVGAAASMHGTSLVTDEATSPHRVARQAVGEIYCGFAEHDPFAAAPIVDTLDRELRAAGVAYAYAVHRDARHGYALPDRDVYDDIATHRDWDVIFAMLRRTPRRASAQP